jgi:hypothetical protein
MRFEAIARGPVGVAGEGVMVHEPEPIVDPIGGHRVYSDVADLRQPFCASCKPLGRVGVVARVVPDRFLRISPGMALSPVGIERIGYRIRSGRLDHRITPEAFDLHGFLLGVDTTTDFQSFLCIRPIVTKAPSQVDESGLPAPNDSRRRQRGRQPQRVGRRPHLPRRTPSPSLDSPIIARTIVAEKRRSLLCLARFSRPVANPRPRRSLGVFSSNRGALEDMPRSPINFFRGSRTDAWMRRA